MGTASTTAGATYGSHPPQHIHGILAELDSRRPNGQQRFSLDKDGHGNLSGQSRRMSSEPPSVLIDNTRHIYIPVKLTCGVRVLCRPEVLRRCPLILHDLNTDLRQCLSILPPSVHALVRRTQVWVNHSYSYGPRNHPVRLNHSTAHHHEAWLMWARDRPDKTLGVEIYNCFDYRRMRLHWNGCGLLLHELSHLFHQQALPGGLDNIDVVEAFTHAKDSGRYDTVLRRDWAGKDLDCDLAYAMVDHKEFFAEMSVSYWSRGYPCELDDEDRSDIDRCSPPILEPNVLARVQGKQQPNKGPKSETKGEQKRQPFDNFRPGNDITQLFRSINDKRYPHCNKFYPFTGGQLKSFDPNTHAAMDAFWRQIAQWEDPYRDPFCSKPPTCFWTPWKTQPPVAIVADTIDL